jgi:hypothetical protein
MNPQDARYNAISNIGRVTRVSILFTAHDMRARWRSENNVQASSNQIIRRRLFPGNETRALSLPMHHVTRTTRQKGQGALDKFSTHGSCRANNKTWAAFSAFLGAHDQLLLSAKAAPAIIRQRGELRNELALAPHVFSSSQIRGPAACNYEFALGRLTLQLPLALGTRVCNSGRCTHLRCSRCK